MPGGGRGGIVISLSNVSGATGVSKTNITQKDDGSAITYSQLLDFDGYVNVHESSSNLGSLVAQGDIGQNELTGESMTYNLNSKSNPAISGSVKFEERKNEETLVTIVLENTAEGGDHPAHIHDNTAAQGGGIAISLSNVNGATGMSKTNVKQTQNGTAITYADLIDFDGYVNVHLSGSELATLIAQGDIGQNGLTGNMKTYDIAEFEGSGVSGTATFYERANGTTLVSLELTGTTPGGTHPAHIHHNSASAGGGIAVSLTAVNGDTGLSATQVETLDNSSDALTYDDLINFNGYINVHLSPTELPTTLARGDIGSNAN